MGGQVSGEPTREPTFGDYLKAAFNVRVRVPGLGGVPINWLYLTAIAGLSFAAWPMLLVGFGAAMLLMPRGACGHRRCGPRRDEPPVKVGPA